MRSKRRLRGGRERKIDSPESPSGMIYVVRLRI